MSEIQIVIVDEDPEFCRRLDGYLRARLSVPVSIHDYTDPDALAAYDKRSATAALVISERALSRAATEGFPRMVILTEGLGVDAAALFSEEDTGAVKPEIRRVNKYSGLGALIREVTACMLDDDSFIGAKLQAAGERAWMTAFFTPLSRSLQTTSALTLGQLLAGEGRALYLCAEPFGGTLRGLVRGAEGGDLTELLYYFSCEPKKLPLHLERIGVSAGALTVIPPAGHYETLTETEPTEWKDFFAALAEQTDYQYIIADCSVCMRGLADLLRGFDRIVTIARNDPVSEEKLNAYEQMLIRSGHEDLMTRTVRLTLPVFRRLPADPAKYGEGELAAFLRQAADGVLLSRGTAGRPDGEDE